MIKVNMNKNNAKINVVSVGTKRNIEQLVAKIHNCDMNIRKMSLDSNLEIDPSAIGNKQKCLILLSYSAGSIVGVTTKGGNLGTTLIDYAEQFFVNGAIDVIKLKKVLKFVGKNEVVGARYQSVFNYGVNKVLLNDRFSRANIIARVSVWEIEECIKRIKSLDVRCITAKDLKLIGEDLDIIARALQELSIDSAKDLSKQLTVNIHSIINCKSNALSDLIKKGTISNNSEIGLKLSLENDNIGDFKYTMDHEPCVLLEDADSNDAIAMADAVIKDSISQAQYAINEGMSEAMDEAFDYLSTCNGGKYNAYLNDVERVIHFNSSVKHIKEESSFTEEEKSEAIEELILCTRMIKMNIIAQRSINSLFSARANGEMFDSSYIKEIASQYRNAIYKEASVYNIPAPNVIKYAISAAFCYLTNDKIGRAKSPSMSALKMIFPREFVIEYIGQPLEVELTLDSTTVDLYADDVIEFTNGFGFIHGGIVSVKEDYTGSATITEEGSICPEFDFYAYDNTVGYCVTGQSYENNILPCEPEAIADNGYNADMTLAVINCLNKTVNGGQHRPQDTSIIGGNFFIKNKDNTNSLVANNLVYNKGEGKNPVGVVTNKYGLICFVK